MSNTLTIEQLRDSLEETIAQLKASKTPVKVVSNGETAAYLVAPDRFISDDDTLTPEEAKQIAIGLKLGEIGVAEGQVITLDEAVERLRKLWEARGDDTALGFMHVAEQGGAFKWLADEPDLYSVDDLKVRYR